MAKSRAKLSTNIGKFIDKITYNKLAFILFAVIFLSAIGYWLLSPLGQGTNKKDISFWDSLYFSVVTFSTVGYGDISPAGFGKLIVVVEILFGVTLLSLLVGKIASERQSALLLLTYTSEQQRRLQEFSIGLDNLCDKIDDALTDHDHFEIYNLSKQGYGYISSISNYLVFQSNQGGLASFGNLSSLRLLYKSISKLQKISQEAVSIFTTKEKAINYFLRLSEKANYIGTTMKKFHPEDEGTQGPLMELNSTNTAILKLMEERKAGRIVIYDRSEITPNLLENVLKAIPPRPWSKNMHKDVAAELSIGIKLAHKCINELVTRGKV